MNISDANLKQRQDRLDDRQLRRVSRKYSRSSMQEAKEVAQQDAIFAEEFLASQRQELLEQTMAEEMGEDTLSATCINICSLGRILTRLGCSLGRFSSAPDAMVSDRSHELVIQVV